MRIIIVVFIAIISFSVSNAQKRASGNQENIRVRKVINSDWTFNYFPAVTADKGYESSGYDDSKWPAVSLPHTWNTFETTGQINPFFNNPEDNDNSYWWSGWGWYRKHFSINSKYSGWKVFIEVGGIRKYCKIWINGKYVGDHKGTPGSFDFDITGFIKAGEDNVIAVAVNNRQESSVSDMLKSGESEDIYSGIFRDVTLIINNLLYISMKGTTTDEGGILVTKVKEGVVRIQTWVKNDNTQKKNCILQTSICDASGKVIQVVKTEAIINPGQLFRFDQMSKPIRSPLTWSEDGKFMNKIFSEVIEGKVVADYFTSLPDAIGNVSDPSELYLIDKILEGLAGNVFSQSGAGQSATFQNVTAGDAVRIVLTGSEKNLLADRGSVAIITADVVDSKGKHVNGVTRTLNWSVTGPAKLVGPSVYESEMNRHHQYEGVSYKDLPVSNIIRSDGKPGKIQVIVSASGLVSGIFEIDAELKKIDNSVVNETQLEDIRRTSVARKTLKVNRLDDVQGELKFISGPLMFNPSDKRGYAKQICENIHKNNTSSDTTTIEFRTLIELFASQILNTNGQLAATDYNLNAGHYNNCRLIAGYISSTKLPPLFKDGLRKYYANLIIRQGCERNAGEEMNWLNWIPSGGTVVIYRDVAGTPAVKGTIITTKSNLPDLITAVHPSFNTFSDEAKERALIFISKMNPYVIARSADGQITSGDKENEAGVTYTAVSGQMVLIPLLKFISE